MRHFPSIPEPSSRLNTDSKARPRWTKWPALCLLGLIIAILAGLVGGFIGKAVEGKRLSGSSSDTTIQAQTSACSTAYQTPFASLTPSNPSDASDIPKTGCPDISNGSYPLGTFRTTSSNATYKLTCNTDWVGKDIGSIHATSYNDIGATCIGATFVPAWINRTLAMLMVGMSGNCFLKYNASGYPENYNKEEVLGVCLEARYP
ncbi:hypothetical protein EK21DRAFT_92720 [Setomelanomma holmii]|uniref:Uncharacterized protein n=1 Tax=Setomelanomma holmii TaxID=210430 RepID=A0A9P4H1V4_9PLEO|nr:hypothetical protein EK21DRAFT_92720 [Setomelanomma holmii]